MIKFLEDQNYEVCFGEDITTSDNILFEVEIKNEGEGEFIFMMTEEPNLIAPPLEELDSITLGDVVGHETVFSPEDIENIARTQQIKRSQIYKVSRFNFFNRRIIESFTGNTTANLSSAGRVDIPIFSKEKVRRWKNKYPDIRYIHIGLIQIKINALFRAGIDIPIIALVTDNRFTCCHQALIGGFQSNLVHQIVWFNIRPNYFISVSDPNIVDTVRLKIKTQGMSMKANSHDLAIECTTIHELTTTTDTRTVSNNKQIIEIFEPKPFETEITPRLMDLKDLSIPRQWYLEDLTQSEKPKDLGGIEIQSSGNSMYIKNNTKQPYLTRNITGPRSSFREPIIRGESSISKMLGETHTPKGEKQHGLNIPLMPGSTARQVADHKNE
jgi:hypothetical protein